MAEAARHFASTDPTYTHEFIGLPGGDTAESIGFKYLSGIFAYTNLRKL